MPNHFLPIFLVLLRPARVLVVLMRDCRRSKSLTWRQCWWSMRFYDGLIVRPDLLQIEEWTD